MDGVREKLRICFRRVVSSRTGRRSRTPDAGGHGGEPVVSRPREVRRFDAPARIALVVFAIVHLTLGTYSSARNAAAWDEPTHLAAGYAELTQSDYRFD